MPLYFRCYVIMLFRYCFFFFFFLFYYCYRWLLRYITQSRHGCCHNSECTPSLNTMSLPRRFFAMLSCSFRRHFAIFRQLVAIDYAAFFDFAFERR